MAPLPARRSFDSATPRGVAVAYATQRRSGDGATPCTVPSTRTEVVRPVRRSSDTMVVPGASAYTTAAVGFKAKRRGQVARQWPPPARRGPQPHPRPGGGRRLDAFDEAHRQ